MGRLTGNCFKEVLEVDVDEDNDIASGDYMRVRANLDIIKPLPSGKRVNMGAASPSSIRFLYERLPNFCYIYRRLGHGMKECKQVEIFADATI